MVYFIGRMPNGMKQEKIDFENNKGKVVRITGPGTNFIIDFGFPNYYYSNINKYFEKTSISNTLMYLENLNETLKAKLVQNESLYVYGENKDIDELKIEYLGKNLKNANNE